jgi:hypothetical protein
VKHRATALAVGGSSHGAVAPQQYGHIHAWQKGSLLIQELSQLLVLASANYCPKEQQHNNL